VGTIQPIKRIVEIVKEKNRRTIIHSDTSQTIGKLQVRVDELGIDLLTVTPHKFYGPKGIGALYRRQGVTLEKLMHGAGHERGLRAGTENVLLAVALGKACELVHRNLESYARHMKETRDLLRTLLLESVPGVRLNGSQEQLLPNTLSVSFSQIKGYEFVKSLGERVCVSAGSACHSDLESISPVLKAMGVPFEQALGTVRFSTGRYTSEKQIRDAVAIIVEFLKSKLNS
jgi:cysteine sulfinate desulfinase/cysteine desulfurase-like protein